MVMSHILIAIDLGKRSNNAPQQTHAAVTSRAQHGPRQLLCCWSQTLARVEDYMSKFRLTSVVLMVALSGSVGLAGQPPQGDSEVGANHCPASGPGSLEEAVTFLDQELSEADKERIREYEGDEYVGALHMGLGMWLRNNLGLWWDCPLTNYFNNRGVAHADNMSGAIIDAYWRHLRNEKYDINSIIQCYSDWEAESERLRNEAEARGEKGFPFPEFDCPDRKPMYPRFTDKQVERTPG